MNLKHTIFLICILLANAFHCDAQADHLYDTSKAQVAPLNFNTEESEFGPYKAGNILYYSSSRERKVGALHMEKGTDHQMLDLYKAKFKDSITFIKSAPLNDAINTPMNQGSCFFDEVNSKLYYSTDIPTGSVKKKYKLAIFSAELKGEEFSPPREELVLPDTFSASHPMVYRNKLYFSSNQEGGKGKTDIYSAELVDGKWTNITNCLYINSEASEFFPFVINENEIYFTSDRSGGFGALDIYKYTWHESGSVIQNAGEPLNSIHDDFAIYMDSLQEKGYFSSNRYENQDDIYFFKQTWPSFKNCTDYAPENYCYNLTEESTLNTDSVKGYYYEWLFGDGTKQKGLSVRHCFPAPGNYTINLNVIDSLTGAIFMSQTSFDLKVDSIVQLKINVLDTVPENGTFTVNSLGTYLPDYDIKRYYYKIGTKKIKGESFTHSFENTGSYPILLGIQAVNKKTKKRELLCTTRNVVCTDKSTWAAVEERRINEELAKYAYRAFKADSNALKNLVSDDEIDLYNKMGLNGQKVVDAARQFVASRKGKKVIEEVTSGQNKFAYKSLPGNLNTLLDIEEGPDVTFKVHFGTSKKIRDTTYLHSKGIVGIQESIINNEYHYTYGNERKVKDIEKFYQNSLKAGLKDPVVIGYKKDQLIFDQSANIKPATFEENKIELVQTNTLVPPRPEVESADKDLSFKNNGDKNAVESVSKENEISTDNSKMAANETSSSNEKNNSKESSSGELKNSTKENSAKQNETSENTLVASSGTSEKNIKRSATKEKREKREKTGKHSNSHNEKETIDLAPSSEGDLPITNEKEFNALTNIQKKTQEFLEKYGDVNLEDLVFKVQVGVFRKRRSYDFPRLKGMGKIENEHLDNGTTRMTIGGSFKTLRDAFNFNKKVVMAGQEDAFVSVFYKGKRIYIENLERKGVLKKRDEIAKQNTDEGTSMKEGEPQKIVQNSTETTSEYEPAGEFVARTNIQKKTVMFAQKYGGLTAPGLEYKVQIAIFKHRKNYNFPKLQRFGSVETEKMESGAVRVTIGGLFTTLNEAFELNKKVVMAGQTDAFVSVYYQGKRIYIENLEQKGIFIVK